MPCIVIACGARESECRCGGCDGGLVHIFLFVGDAVVADGWKLDKVFAIHFDADLNLYEGKVLLKSVISPVVKLVS